MKITKRQLRRIIKEEISRNILIEKKKKNKKKKKKKPKRHPYFLLADAHEDKYESRTDTVGYMWHDIMDVLHPPIEQALREKGQLRDDEELPRDLWHPLAKRIDQMTDDGSPNSTDVEDEIEEAIDDGSVPADLRDSLLALGTFDDDDEDDDDGDDDDSWMDDLDWGDEWMQKE